MDFEDAFAGLEPAPRDRGEVRLICLRVDEGVHETPERAEVTVEDGLVGDRWASGKRDLDAQITLMNVRVAELIAPNGTAPHMAGDNFSSIWTFRRRRFPWARGSASARRCSRSRRSAHGLQEVPRALRARGARVGETTATGGFAA